MNGPWEVAGKEVVEGAWAQLGEGGYLVLFFDRDLCRLALNSLRAKDDLEPPSPCLYLPCAGMTGLQ